MTLPMVAIGFSTSSSSISTAIRWKTKVPELSKKEMPSHAWILHEAYGDEYVMQAEWTGFGVISYSHFKKENTILQVIPIAEKMALFGVDARARVCEAAEWLGDSYDWWSLLRFVVPKLIRGDSPKALLCTEAVVRAFPELFPGMGPEGKSAAQLLVQLRK